MSEVIKNEWPLWEVFTQKRAGAPHEHAGSVHASDKEMAIQMARDVYTRRNEAINLWVVLSENIIATQPDEAGSLFDPANDKAYRHPNFFRTPEGVKL